MKSYGAALKNRVKSILEDKDSGRLLFNVAGNYVVKACSMLVSLLVMPAYMTYFSSQTLLGMWFTAVSIIEWVLLFDFGIGAGMRNQIIAPLNEGNKQRTKEIISAAYFSVGIIAAILIVVQHFIVEWVDWYSVFGIQTNDIDANTLYTVLHILLIGVCIRFFSALILHLLYALQKASLVSLVNLLSSVFILVYLKLATPTGNNADIIKLALVQALATNVPAFVTMIVVFAGRLKGMLPSLSYFHVEQAKSVLGTSGWLFYLQTLLMFVFGVKEIFISWFVGAEQVVDYQIYQKLIGIVGSLFALALSPIWSAVTKAYIEKKTAWIKNLYKQGTKMIALFSLGQLVLVLMMPLLSKVWLGSNAIEIHLSYGLIFCLYNSIYMWVMMNYQFACGLECPKTISACLTFSLAANLILSFAFSRVYPSWISVVTATSIALIPCAVLAPKDIWKAISHKNRNLL